MKKKLTILALTMMMGLSACGNKADAPAVSESSAASGSSVAASSVAESASKEPVINVNEVIDDIKNAGVLREGDVTNRIISNGETTDEFTFSGEATYLVDGEYTYDENTDICFLSRKPEQGVRIPNSGTPYAEGSEGCYRYWMDENHTVDGAPWHCFFFQSDSSKENIYYEIEMDIYDKDVDVQKYADVFLSLTEGFVKSGLGSDTKVSNVSFDTEQNQFVIK